MTSTPTKPSPWATLDECADRLILRREPDEEGLREYERLIAPGMSIERLASFFLESAEFNDLRKSNLLTVKLDGYSVCLDSKDNDLTPGILMNRDYEPHVRQAISQLFHEGQTFVDLGANVGCISFHAAKIAGPNGRVISFEPNPPMFKASMPGS